MNQQKTNQTDKKIILRGRLDGSQRNRLAKVMNMMYSPSELADEIGFDRRQIYRVYIPLGCPHSKDKRNRIWINGIEFVNWVLDIYKKRNLSKDEAFCIQCKIPVKMKNPVRKENKGLIYFLCQCPHCNRNISKIITKNFRK